MKKYLYAVLFSIILLSNNASAAAEQVSVIGVEAAGYNSYIWRGIVLDTDPVFQPEIYASFKHVTLSIFSNMDLGTDNYNSNENDMSFDYTKEYEGLSLSAGAIYYDFSGIHKYAREYYTGVRFTKAPAMPYLSYYYEEGSRNGTYFSADFVQKIKLSDDTKLNTSAGLHFGYNSGIIVQGTGSDIGLLFDIGYPVTKIMGGSLVFGYTVPFGGLKDSGNLGQSAKFYCGARVGF